ncbi:DUF5682 family protein [Stackebrandtia soli]|uniref:DUF5682 family protein n=1 Tax=Stackebrandtia soli TaxID=1892856 RepID=UPI0039ED4B00
MDDPNRAVERLAESRVPFLIGVRHHSAALAAAVPQLLAAADPDAVLIELPTQLQPWLTWLSDPKTEAPVALAIAHQDGRRLGFYPFADFSPELAALRWAREHDIPAHAIDVSVDAESGTEHRGIAARLHAAAHTTDTGDTWERLVETPSYGADPERVRRAALAYGWALRADADPVSPADLEREAHMRRRVAEIGAARPVAVVGSFHAAAFLDAPTVEATATDETKDDETVTSLIPYSFALLDSRSGYPAGVHDPVWHQRVAEVGGDPAAVDALAAETVSAVCARLRKAGHAAGTADAIAAYTMTRDLAVLRGLPAPGRGEIVEAMQSALTQGEPLGRARAVAAAAEHVLVGIRRGRVAPGAPRSGLVRDVERLRTELRLPDQDPAYRIDPFKSPLDKRRHVTLHRLRAAGVDYATPVSTSGVGGVDSVSRGWSLNWTPRASATAELAAIYGPDLVSAATGRLRANLWRAGLVSTLAEAAEAGLVGFIRELLSQMDDDFAATAGLPDLIATHRLVHAIHNGGYAGLDEPPAEAASIAARLLARAVAGVDGFAGATSDAELAALRDLIGLVDDDGRATLSWRLRRIADATTASAPAAQGAAAAALVSLRSAEPEWLATQVASWVEHGADVGDRLRGVLVVAAPLVEASLEVLTALSRRVGTWSPEVFLARLPNLRYGFETLSTAARERFLRAIGVSATPATTSALTDLPRYADADNTGFAAVAAMLAVLDGPTTEPAPSSTPDESAVPPALATKTAKPADHVDIDQSTLEEIAAELDDETKHRWRLILGRETEALPSGQRRFARALDELYGHGHGEGSNEGGGTEEPYPTVREWAEELSDLFGGRVRDEVLAKAASAGRSEAVLELDPENVTASVDLLTTVLSMAGALPESKLGALRKLAQRLIDELTKALAVEMRPALTGLTVPRPTARPTGRLDLAATLRRNLRTAQRDGDEITITAERPVFRSRGNRSASWHVHLVVDVSGSMERSVVYSALTAAILHGVPSLSVNFTTFSTRVADFTDRVEDPLSLLMEVSVGGGTDIGKALAYTRERLTVPSRSIVAVISDFEEGASTSRLLGQVRALAETGAVLLGLAALDDSGVPVYNASIAAAVADAGMPVAALSPSELASWIGSKVRNR